VTIDIQQQQPPPQQQQQQGSTAAGDANGEVRVRISDTGIGVPEANVPYLFDEFYQVNNYERDRSKGFGMGLAICKSLARHIGADVRLAGTSPEGSCFEVVLSAGSGNGTALGADRRGRSGGASGDRPDPAEAGLCGV
jgi:signal transduction histidine kinase